MHYSNNPWVNQKHKRGPSKTISKRTCAIKRNTAKFNNLSDLRSVPHARRQRALEQNQQWSSFLVGQPRDALHRSCYVYKDGTIPRQTTAWLVEEYCKSEKVEYQTVFDCITASNGDINDPRLMTTDAEGTVHINLLALDDPTLWRVYQQIPAHQLAAHPPSQRPPPQRTLLEPPPEPPPEPLEPPPIEEVFWVCCDTCSKWRRVSAEPEGENWECSAILVSCDKPEDDMDNDEKWSGDVKGEQRSVLPSAVPSEVPESQDPATAPPNDDDGDGGDGGDDDVNSVDLFGESGSEDDFA